MKESINLYVFGMNYNPVTKEDESELTEIRIPAKSESEARQRLGKIVGKALANKFCLHDVRDY